MSEFEKARVLFMRLEILIDSGILMDFTSFDGVGICQRKVVE